jgi:DNA-binding LacI/PurR family transcriptional regulator
MATIADVARAAGVSRSTASYALTGKRTVSPRVRERIQQAVAELGYTPNAGARALATSETRIIALLAQFLPDEFAPAMLQYMRGVSARAQELGYDILLVSDDDGAGALRRLSTTRMVDGFILLNVKGDDDRLPVLRDASQPGALVGLPNDPSGVDVFDLDFPESGRVMVDRLHAEGHREAILVSQSRDVVERGGAYVRRLADAALARARELGMILHDHHGSSMQPQVGADLHAFLDEHPGATGLLLNNEAASAALPTVLRDRGLSVPEDMSVLGRFSDEFARTFSLPYSAVDSAAVTLGGSAVEALVARMQGGHEDDERVLSLLRPVIDDRGSLAPPRRQDR